MSYVGHLVEECNILGDDSTTRWKEPRPLNKLVEKCLTVLCRPNFFTWGENKIYSQSSLFVGSVFLTSLKFICHFEINTHGTFSVICGHLHTQSGEKFESSNKHIPSRGLTRQCSIFLFQLFNVNKLLFYGMYSSMFRNIAVLCW